MAAAVIDRRYRWVVTLEPLIVIGVDELLVIDRFGVGGVVEVLRGLEFDRLWWKGSDRRAC
jgi:hypothetical protein